MHFKQFLIIAQAHVFSHLHAPDPISTSN